MHYAKLYAVFESWHKQGLLPFIESTSGWDIDDIDLHIAKVFSLPFPSGEWGDYTTRLKPLLASRDLDWLLSDNAFVLYKVLLARVEA